MNTQTHKLPENPGAPWVRKLALLAVAAFLTATGVLMLRPTNPTPPEVLRASLSLRDGKLFVKGQASPFTGAMVERYESGALKSRSFVSNGLLHGASQGWYTNRQLQITEHFSAGVAHGLRTKWHPNGRKSSEGMIVNGELHGTFRRWSEDGALAEVIEMKHGQPDGLSRAYYPSGFLKAEVRLRRGEVLDSKFWQDGEQKTPALTRRDE